MNHKKNYNFSASSKGFTLIELLIAATIFAIVLVVIYSTFSTGILALKKENYLSEKHHSIRIGLTKLTTELRNALYTSEMTIVGNAQELYFYTIIPSEKKDELNLTGIYKITYSFDKDKGQLLRTEEPYISTLRFVDSTTEQTIIIPRNMTNFSFNYYGDATEEEKEEEIEILNEEEKEKEKTVEWKENWKFKYGCPKQINMAFSIHNEDSEEKTNFQKIISIYRGKLWDDDEPSAE